MTGRTGIRSWAVTLADAAAAAILVTAVLLWAGLRSLRRKATRGGAPKLLTFEATYSLQTIRERKLEHEITCRDVGGFFQHVWSVHPMVGASPEHSPDAVNKPPSAALINERHTMIEGPVSRFERLEHMPFLNFAIAQAILLRQLSRLIEQQDISLIRSGDPYYLGLLGLLLARMHRLPLVVRINANYDLLYATTGAPANPRLLRSRAFERRIERFVLARADLVAPGSEDNLRYALASGARPERSTIFRYGVWIDPVHFRLDPVERDTAAVCSELGVSERPFVVLVSRLVDVKHPEDVLEALAEAKRDVPELAAVFVGDGPMRDELAARARELGIVGDVFFAGNRTQDFIAHALTAASVVLSPLTGRALVEACLSGTPVIAYDVEWHGEIVRTGETGVLVPYRSTKEMGRAIVELVENPGHAERLAKRAREATLDMMDPERLMSHERAQYERLLTPW